MSKHRIKIRKGDFSSQRIEKHKDYAQLLERHQRASGLKFNNYLVSFVVLACVLAVSYYALDRIEQLDQHVTSEEQSLNEDPIQNVEPIPQVTAGASPRPQSGMAAYNRYLQENLGALEGLEVQEGVVYVGFDVAADGSLSEVRAVKGLCPKCDLIAIDLIKKGPKWLPAQRNGEAIKAPMVVPITFAIEAASELEIDPSNGAEK